MKQKYYLRFISLPILFLICSSCNNLDLLNVPVEEECYDVIIKERHRSLPEEVVNREMIFDTEITKASNENTSNSFLGRGYRFTGSYLANPDCLRPRVLDLTKIRTLEELMVEDPDDEGYIISDSIPNSERRIQTYANADRYHLKTNTSEKIVADVDVDVWKLNIGFNLEHNELFEQTNTDSSYIAYGDIHLNTISSSHRLSCPEGARKLYARQCLSNSFLRNLYTSSIGNMINTYGSFLLSGYHMGGKALGLYRTEFRHHLNSSQREDSLYADINVSCKWKSDSVSVGMKFNSVDYNSETSENERRVTQVYIKTYGGQGGIPNGSGSIDISSLSLDLTSWENSLNDISTHTIIDVLDEGLCPISAILLEKNFQRRYDDTFAGILEPRSSLITPYIEIVRVYVRKSATGIPLYEIAPVLNTRHGDKIILSTGDSLEMSDQELLANNETTVFNQKVSEILSNMEDMYWLEFRKNSSTKYNPSVLSPLCIRINGYNEANMYRCRNEETGVEYIYDRRLRVAFSYYTDSLDGDWILDDYGIRDWVENLPERNISMATLSSYDIIGL